MSKNRCMETRLFRACRISHRVSHSLDTEISPPYPESWREGIFKQTFTEGVENDAWV